MSAFLLRNNSNKIYFKSYQLIRNLKILSKNSSASKQSNLPIQSQPIPACRVKREDSSKSLTIKQYKSSRKYTITWKLERLLGWSLFILIPTAFAVDSKELEMALCTSAILHTYLGCQSMSSDYLRSNVVGKLLPIIGRLSIVFLTIISMAGAYQLVYEDVGLINMIKKFWCIRGKDYVLPKHLQKVGHKHEEKSKSFFRRWF